MEIGNGATLEMIENLLDGTTPAAEALYIHRNTLYQRLSKIEALITSNLNNPETRLYLQISYQIGDFS